MEKSKKILIFLLLLGCIIVFGKNEALAKARYSYASVNANVKTDYTEEIEAPEGWFSFRVACWQRKVEVTAMYSDQACYEAWQCCLQSINCGFSLHCWYSFAVLHRFLDCHAYACRHMEW